MLLVVLVLFGSMFLRAVTTREAEEPPAHKFDYNPDRYKIPPEAYDLMPKRPEPAEVKPLPIAPKPEERKDFVGPPRPPGGGIEK
jgi:hypothetical protein